MVQFQQSKGRAPDLIDGLLVHFVQEGNQFLQGEHHHIAGKSRHEIDCHAAFVDVLREILEGRSIAFDVVVETVEG